MSGTSIPRTDYRNYNKRKVVKSAWKVEWGNVNNNKLRVIKLNIEHLKHVIARVGNEIKLNRLRIGHIRLTQEYLISGDNQRYCPDCIVPLTVYHISVLRLLKATKYLGQPQLLKEVLGDKGPVLARGSLYSFLVETNVID